MSGSSLVDGCLFEPRRYAAGLTTWQGVATMIAFPAAASLALFAFDVGPDGPPIVYVSVLLIGLFASIALIRAATDEVRHRRWATTTDGPLS